MRRVLLISGIIAAASTAVLANQQQPPPEENGGRYSFHRRGENFIRLDNQTGYVAQCGWNSIGWACTMAPDERAALEAEIGRLQRENTALKKSLIGRDGDLPERVMGEPKPIPPLAIPDPSPGAPKPLDPRAAQDGDVDRAIAYVRNVWRRLVDIVVELQREVQRKG
jgi:hypothetical protein